jgi:predicted metalloprotease with PDZ domain
LDVLIMKHSSNKNNLQTVMKNLYDNFYKKQKGYTEQDFTHACSVAASIDLQDFFTKYVYGLETYEPMLHECAGYIGVELYKHHALTFYERYLGLKAAEVNHHKKVNMVAPYSPAWKANISINDEIIAINGFMLKNDLNPWLTYFHQKEGTCVLTVNSSNCLKEIPIDLKTEGDFFYTYKLVKQENSTVQQKENYNIWKKSFTN